MDRRDRELLNRQMSRFQHNLRRDGVLILALAGVFIAGLTAGERNGEHQTAIGTLPRHARLGRGGGRITAL